MYLMEISPRYKFFKLFVIKLDLQWPLPAYPPSSPLFFSTALTSGSEILFSHFGLDGSGFFLGFRLGFPTPITAFYAFF